MPGSLGADLRGAGRRDRHRVYRIVGDAAGSDGTFGAGWNDSAGQYRQRNERAAEFRNIGHDGAGNHGAAKRWSAGGDGAGYDERHYDTAKFHAGGDTHSTGVRSALFDACSGEFNLA
jgi:hypothetical protein